MLGEDLAPAERVQQGAHLDTPASVSCPVLLRLRIKRDNHPVKRGACVLAGDEHIEGLSQASPSPRRVQRYYIAFAETNHPGFAMRTALLREERPQLRKRLPLGPRVRIRVLRTSGEHYQAAR